MANIRRNTSYGTGTYGEPNYSAGCCEWCDDNARGNSIKYPPVGCNDAMCSDPTFASGCSNKGYGTITTRPSISPFPITSAEEWSNAEGDMYQDSDISCDDILGGCPTNIAIGQIPAPKTDYKKGDIIKKQFSNTCGPYEVVDSVCGEALTTFQGTITGEVQLGKLEPKQYEVEWDLIGDFDVPAFSYVSPSNIFFVSSPLDEEDEEIKNIEIIEEENSVLTAGLGDSKIMLFAVAFVGAYLLFSANNKK